MSNDTFEPLQPGQPREENIGGIKGGSRKTRFYREQLRSNPGKWFVWKVKSPYASDTGGALRTLTGINNLSGIDRSELEFQATAQKQEDGTYTTYVRFTGETVQDEQETVAPLEARTNDVVTNPFGANV